MGGLSCVEGKPEEPVEGEEGGAEPKSRDKQELLDMAYRQSLQVYCGEPKKKKEPQEDKPPEPTDQDKQDDNRDGTANKENSEVKSEMDVETKETKSSENTADIDSVSYIDEEADTLPTTLESLPNKRYTPPGFPSYNPSPRVIKRPRSLDSADHRQISRLRPLSYSPGPLKTKHPRSLHSINEVTNTLPKERPKSMDISAIFDSSGFDIHSQKLRRMLTQKGPNRKITPDRPVGVDITPPLHSHI